MLKKIMSWLVVVPALVTVCSEAECLTLELVRLLAILILIGVAFWTNAFSPEQIPTRRRINDNNNYQRYIARRRNYR